MLNTPKWKSETDLLLTSKFAENVWQTDMFQALISCPFVSDKVLLHGRKYTDLGAEEEHKKSQR